MKWMNDILLRFWNFISSLFHGIRSLQRNKLILQVGGSLGVILHHEYFGARSAQKYANEAEIVYRNLGA